MYIVNYKFVYKSDKVITLIGFVRFVSAYRYVHMHIRLSYFTILNSIVIHT